MKKFKIIKETHTYSNNMTKFVVYQKCFIGWSLAKYYSFDFKYQYDSFKDAEIAIFNYFKTKNGGIISIDVNVYTYSPYSLPIP